MKLDLCSFNAATSVGMPSKLPMQLRALRPGEGSMLISVMSRVLAISTPDCKSSWHQSSGNVRDDMDGVIGV